MTELFKCRKSGTKCCAPKSMIREVSQKDDNETKTESIKTNMIHTSTQSTIITTVHTSKDD